MRDSEAVIDSAVVTRHDGVRHAVRLKPFVTGHLKREIIYWNPETRFVLLPREDIRIPGCWQIVSLCG